MTTPMPKARACFHDDCDALADAADGVATERVRRSFDGDFYFPPSLLPQQECWACENGFPRPFFYFDSCLGNPSTCRVR